MKKACKVLWTVFVWLMVLFAAGMMVFTIFSVNSFNRNDRAVFGHKMYIVLSDSMSATHFSAGDLVVVKEVDPNSVQVGDVISFISPDGENYGQVMTHKVRARTTTESGDPGFITYGTTTGVDDEFIVAYSAVQGKYAFSIPKLGSFFNFMRTPRGYLVCILLPFMLLILYQGINCVRIFRQYKREQMQELQAEKDAIVAERKRTEEMLAQLMQMKEQLAGMASSGGEPMPQESAGEGVQETASNDEKTELAEEETVHS